MAIGARSAVGVSGVDPFSGPEFTPPSVGALSSRLSAGASQDSAQLFATMLRAQMSSMMTSAALGGLGDGASGGTGGFGGMGGGLFGGGSGGGFGLDSLMLMQTLGPLTAAIEKLVDHLEGGAGELSAEIPFDGDTENVTVPQSVPYRGLLQRMSETYQVPTAFLAAVMMAESGGRPDAVGDEGASVGLFQLHERGMGQGLGDLRLDPELNASIGARGLAAGWHEGLRRGLEGERLVRFAYDYRFNPGGGNGYQGDAVISNFAFYRDIARRDQMAT